MLGFVRVVTGLRFEVARLLPVLRQLTNDGRDGRHIFEGRSEVPALGECLRISRKLLSQEQIAAERF